MFGRRRKIIASGDSVYLFAPSRDSADDFLAMTTSSRGFHEPWVFPPTDLTRYKAYLERLARGNAYGFLIARLDDDSVAGVININDVIMGGFLSGSLGYYAAAPYCGRGYMSEGLALVLDYAFGALDLHRIESNIQPNNAASLALVKRLGFRKEGFSPAFLRIDGEWRDHERWAMLNEEWMAAHHQDGTAPVSRISHVV
jgi:ribosomal-protein-alanine N-acetyltransferase